MFSLRCVLTNRVRSLLPLTQLAVVHDDLAAMRGEVDAMEQQREEVERHRTLLQAQVQEAAVKNELLQQQKVRLGQEKFVLQVCVLATPKGASVLAFPPWTTKRPC